MNPQAPDRKSNSQAPDLPKTAISVKTLSESFEDANFISVFSQKKYVLRQGWSGVWGYGLLYQLERIENILIRFHAFNIFEFKDHFSWSG